MGSRALAVSAFLALSVLHAAPLLFEQEPTDTTGTAQPTPPHPPPCGNCDDGNACTIDVCMGSGCFYVAENCDDGNPCTIDACDAATGCRHDPVGCGNACQECYPGDGLCHAKDCNDSVACTTDSCDPASGCVHTVNEAYCYPCGICDPSQGCVADPTGEGQPCYLYPCLRGVCRSENCVDIVSTCNDDNPCTQDSCSDGECHHYSCSWYGGACSYCVNGVGCRQVDCSDTNPCTQDYCQPGGGASYSCFHDASPGRPCDDGNACTTNDVCGSTVAAGCSGTPQQPPTYVGESVRLAKEAGGVTVTWDPALAPGQSFDLVRGSLARLPVGSAPAFETCLLDDGPTASVTDTDPVPSGEGSWYLVRRQADCGLNGSYGWQGINGLAGPERITGTCP